MIKKYPGWAVMAAWGLFNAVLVAVLVVYQGHIIAVALYAGAVVLLEAAAVPVLLSARRGGDVQQRQRLAVQGAAALPLMAVGLTLALLTLAYGPWMLSLAVPLLLVACALAIHAGAWRKGGPS
ncbi:hypothetical protein RKE30_20275 [Streptomyces sp. Li-HN-5-11]|uniref:hypothetical protein n=1 Tax=Streptomyces sp. Li-HN-5-11 TaxID=3075432 RepID=UPI0028A8DC23|nr:hypothetical protein [Streptomyces sp. Li-HN-5-11]WNM32586.1 hypothetical protein RKE30_20275 [Streptomyces sp. Li-HN-5-11]